MRDEQNYINGRFVETADAGFLGVIDPATGESIGRVRAASEADAVAAVAAASEAQRAWRLLPAASRAELLRKFADAIIERAPRIGAALALESGKSLEDATNEARYAAEITRYHAEWARRIEG
ncbi:aldehyde dehydrogenase family protein, partial [Burkholderia gladioli]